MSEKRLPPVLKRLKERGLNKSEMIAHLIKYSSHTRDKAKELIERHFPESDFSTWG